MHSNKTVSVLWPNVTHGTDRWCKLHIHTGSPDEKHRQTQFQGQVSLHRSFILGYDWMSEMDTQMSLVWTISTVPKLEQNFGEKNLWEPNHTKPTAYKNWGLTAFSPLPFPCLWFVNKKGLKKTNKVKQADRPQRGRKENGEKKGEWEGEGGQWRRERSLIFLRLYRHVTRKK